MVQVDLDKDRLLDQTLTLLFQQRGGVTDQTEKSDTNRLDVNTSIWIWI